MSRPSRGWGVRLAPWLGNGQIWNGEHFANYTSNRWCRKCVIFFLCRNKNAVLLRMSLIDLNVGLRYFGCVNFVFRCCPNPLPSPLVGAVRLRTCAKPLPTVWLVRRRRSRVGPYDVVEWWLEKSPKSQLHPAAVPDCLGGMCS